MENRRRFFSLFKTKSVSACISQCAACDGRGRGVIYIFLAFHSQTRALFRPQLSSICFARKLFPFRPVTLPLELCHCSNQFFDMCKILNGPGKQIGTIKFRMRFYLLKKYSVLRNGNVAFSAKELREGVKILCSSSLRKERYSFLSNFKFVIFLIRSLLSSYSGPG